MVAITDEDYYKERFDFWDDVYGLKMNAMKQQVFKEVFFDFVGSKYLISSKYPIYKLDLNTVNLSQLNFIQSYKLDISENVMVCGLSTWFDLKFSKSFIPMILSSSPFKDYENFYHGIFYLKKPFLAKKGDTI